MWTGYWLKGNMVRVFDKDEEHYRKPLSSSLMHEDAKTANALIQNRLGAVFVFWEHGGEQEVRENLLDNID